VLRAEPVDLVIALNPMSSLDVSPPRNVRERLARGMREAAGRRLGHEAKRLRAAGIEVVLIQPTAEDLEVMGGNLMSSRRRHEVIETATQTVTKQLRESALGGQLSNLPAGDPRLVRRPHGPPSTWPDFRAAAMDRWTELRAA
jgi:NTE family protein